MLDNIMISVISTIMIFLGFINGYIVAYGIALEKELKLNKKLQEAIDKKFESDQEVDELNERYAKLSEKYSYYSSLIYKLSNELPPLPLSPLARCNSPCYDSDYALSPLTDSSSMD